MLNSAPVKEYEVKDFCAFADIFLPLRKSTSRTLSLGM